MPRGPGLYSQHSEAGKRIKASFSYTESFRPVGDTSLVLKVRLVGRVLRPILLKDTVTDFRNCKVQGFP